MDEAGLAIGWPGDRRTLRIVGTHTRAHASTKKRFAAPALLSKLLKIELEFSMKTIDFCVALLCVAFLGCGGSNDGLQLYDVEGAVTFDGQPIENGKILFRKLDGDERGFAANIINGRYKLQSLPGEARVEIRASRIIPGKFDMSNGEPEPVGEMYIPKHYNRDSELTANVSSEGENEFGFDLTSAPK